jgi:pyruvate formate lyase activating enzyme
MENISLSNVVPGRYWHALPDGHVQYGLCPRECKLHERQRGLCFVRAGQDDHIVLSFGTAGCNRTCKFCQDRDISKARELDRLQSEASPRAIAEAALVTGARSVEFTYNDPMIFLEYAIDVAAACRETSLKTVVVTTGYIGEAARPEFFAAMDDAANIDLKAVTEAFYKRLCAGSLASVLDTFRYVKHETETWLKITTLLIPGKNDSEAKIAALSEWVMRELGPDVSLDFTAVHPDWKMQNTPSTPPPTLNRARNPVLGVALHYVYTGNVYDERGQSTYCASCGTRLIGRDWYQITSWPLDAEGCCAACGEPCPGLFDPRPRSWGVRRMPVDIAAA